MSNALTINPIGTVETCQVFTISWTFGANPAAEYNFAIYNLVAFSGESAFASPFYEVLASGISNDTTSISVQANFPAGQYQINCYSNQIQNADTFVSNPFQAVPGSDQSCLGGIYTDVGSAQSTATPVAVAGDSSSSSGISRGAIAGIVVGVCAGLLALLLLVFFARRRRINRLSALRRSSLTPYAFGMAAAHGSNVRPPSSFVVKTPVPGAEFNPAIAGPNEYPPDKKSPIGGEQGEQPYERAFTHARIASTSRVPPPSYDSEGGVEWN